MRAAQNHFHWSQWVSDLPSILSMVLNRGNRENVIADKSALNDVEDLDKTLARINNGGEYLGEFSFTVVLYGWEDAASSEARPRGRRQDLRQPRSLADPGDLQRAERLSSHLSRQSGLQSAPDMAAQRQLRGPVVSVCALVGEKMNRHLGSENLVVLETNERHAISTSTSMKMTGSERCSSVRLARANQCWPTAHRSLAEG